MVGKWQFKHRDKSYQMEIKENKSGARTYRMVSSTQKADRQNMYCDRGI